MLDKDKLTIQYKYERFGKKPKLPFIVENSIRVVTQDEDYN